jgi:Fe-S-cluster-containing dehydrogenase component
MGGSDVKGWYFVIDVAKCEDCKNCFLSCKDEFVGNDWPGYSAPMPDRGESWIAVEGKERGQYPFIDVAYLPAPCMHCDDAPCIRAAGNGACYKRPDGIVIIDPVKAKGREDLPNVCPYGAIRWNNAMRLPQKCTLCAHLLDSGWKQPRCVQSCPTGAIQVMQSEADGIEPLVKAEGLEVYHPEFGTHPRVFYKNLYRFTRCFIGGSVAVVVDGREECSEGTAVTLVRGDGSRVAEHLTDNYGDFKFDNLEAEADKYTLRIAPKGYAPKTIELELTTSLNIGVMLFQAKS